MITARIFPHGGGQAIQLPAAIRLEGLEVGVERQGDALLLKPALTVPAFRSFTEIGKYLAEQFPDAEEFPEPPPRNCGPERPAPIF